MSRRTVFLAGTLLFASGRLPGQVPREDRAPETYGITRPIVSAALASEFAPPASTVGWSFHESGSGGVSRYQTTADSIRWWAQLRVPDGALIQGLDLEACDFTTTGQIAFGLRRTRFDDGEDILPTGGTGLAATPGCAYSNLFYDSPITVDNSNYDYWLFVQWEGEFSSNNRFHAVHSVYRLQVSPPPPYVTFNDVPATHPFFQFVEALAYSGITAGCGGGDFCPDAPLTRGQMAVFLAKALGLQWP